MAAKKSKMATAPEDENTLPRAQDFSVAVDRRNFIFAHNLPLLLLKKTIEPDFSISVLKNFAGPKIENFMKIMKNCQFLALFVTLTPFFY